MDTLWMRLIDYGVAGVLMACICAYTWFILTKVLPKQQKAHVDDLKEMHRVCEEKLEQVSGDFAGVLKEQRKAHIALLERMANKLEGIDTTVQNLCRRVKGSES